MMNSNGENFDMGDLTFEEFVEKYNELTAEQLEVWNINQKGLKKVKIPT